MPTIRDSVVITTGLLDKAASWYEEEDVPAAFQNLHPSVLKTAYKLAAGNWHRCVLGKDNRSLVVYYRIMW